MILPPVAVDGVVSCGRWVRGAHVCSMGVVGPRWRCGPSHFRYAGMTVVCSSRALYGVAYHTQVEGDEPSAVSKGQRVAISDLTVPEQMARVDAPDISGFLHAQYWRSRRGAG